MKLHNCCSEIPRIEVFFKKRTGARTRNVDISFLWNGKQFECCGVDYDLCDNSKIKGSVQNPEIVCAYCEKDLSDFRPLLKDLDRLIREALT